MKTTLEIPDPLFRKAKARAAERGQSLKDFVTDALQARLEGDSARGQAASPRWMAGFGKLQRLGRETARIQKAIDTEFDVVEVEDQS